MPETRPQALSVGQYRGRIESADGEVRKFRLLLFAALPDRIHAEVVGPLGATHLILDAGDGRLAVTAARRGVAWAGEADPRVLEDVVGVRIGLGQLVEALLLGEIHCDGCEVVRTGAEPGTLPERLELSVDASRLGLELKRMRALDGSGDELGVGRPPDGVTVHPLDEIDLTEEDRALTPEAGDS